MSREKKYSGIPWIGDIPKNWRLSRYKFFATSRMGETILSEDTKECGIPVYSATQDGKIFGYVETSKILLHRGDLVIPARGNSIGCISVVREEVATCTQTTICSYNIRNIYSSFLCYCGLGLKDEWFKFDGSAIPQITVSQVNNNLLPLPSVAEQEKIADFLDKKCAEVNEMVALQEKMIEELKAYKQSVITEAVTKGLNPNVTMKDSGIEWIGEIPEHWKKHPFKAYFKTSKGLSITKENLVEEGVPVISYGQIHSKNNSGTSLSNELFRYVSEEYISTNPECLSNVYDLFFADTSEDREGAGNIVFIDTDTPIFAGYHTIIARPKEQVKTKYIAYLIKTDAWRSLIRSRVQGVKLYSISQKFINQTSIIIPPIHEQQQIADYLDDKCSAIDNLISIKQQKIEELKDYKKSIIYEYVTGKKEVE